MGDHVGSATLELAPGGWSLSASQYAPFGVELAGSSTSSDSFKFTGLERDSELQEDHAQFRQLAYLQGRWTSPDPYDGSMNFGDPQSLNRYSYVGNNPLSYTDPSGLFPIGCGFGVSSKGEGGTEIGFGKGTGGIVFTVAGAVGCGIGAIYEIIHLFHHPSLKGTTTPRPNGRIWDEHGGFKVTPFRGVGDLLGLPGGCEFGACGSGFAPDHQTASGTNPFPGIISDAAWLWALHADRMGVHGLWTFGNWCGAGGSGNPTSRLDGACLQHDFCYFQNGLHAGDNLFKPSEALHGCNQPLCNAAVQVIGAEDHKGGDLQQAAAAQEVYSYFTGVREAARCTY